MFTKYAGTIAHTDGSKQGIHCTAVVLIICNGRFVAELWERVDGRTSIGTELAGVLKAARYFERNRKHLCPPYRIYTDCLEIVYSYVNAKTFIPKTYKKDWAELISIGESLDIEVLHVKGHSSDSKSNPNKVCDALAKTVCGMDLSQDSVI